MSWSGKADIVTRGERNNGSTALAWFMWEWAAKHCVSEQQHALFNDVEHVMWKVRSPDTLPQNLITGDEVSCQSADVMDSRKTWYQLRRYLARDCVRMKA